MARDENALSNSTSSRAKGLYIIEWRVPLGEKPFAHGPVRAHYGTQEVLGHDWERFHIEVAQLLATAGAAGIIRPILSQYDEEPAVRAGLLPKLVAEAVVACLKTAVCLPFRDTPSAEFRLVECSYQSSWSARRLPVLEQVTNASDEMGAVASKASA